MKAEPDLQLDVTWLPFELHPETPVASMPLSDYFSHLTPDQVDQMHEGPKARAAELGLPFNQPPILANTRKALALAEYARDAGRLDALHMPLFQAFFVRGQNLADEGVLREVAATAGLDPDAALSAVNEGRYAERLNEYAEQARAYGVTGVPAFIVNNRYKIVGAHPYEKLRDAFRQIQQQG